MAKRRRFKRRVFPLRVEEAVFHPGHEGVPGIREREFSGLLQSVEINGVQTPVETLGERDAKALGEPDNAGTILDGRQRIRAAKECGLEIVPAVEARIPEGMATAEYIYRKAVERRHLTPGQRAILGVELKRMLGKGQGRRTDLRQGGAIEALKGQARDQAGRMVGVSGRLVTTAEKLLREAPELAEKVRAGEAKLGEAIREHNQASGKARRREQADHAMVTFKRFASSFEKIDPEAFANPKARGEIARMLGRLEQRLRKLRE